MTRVLYVFGYCIVYPNILNNLLVLFRSFRQCKLNRSSHNPCILSGIPVPEIYFSSLSLSCYLLQFPPLLSKNIKLLFLKYPLYYFSQYTEIRNPISSLFFVFLLFSFVLSLNIFLLFFPYPFFLNSFLSSPLFPFPRSSVSVSLIPCERYFSSYFNPHHFSCCRRSLLCIFIYCPIFPFSSYLHIQKLFFLPSLLNLTKFLSFSPPLSYYFKSSSFPLLIPTLSTTYLKNFLIVLSLLIFSISYVLNTNSARIGHISDPIPNHLLP